jgi:hypothetical protein
MAWTLPEQSVRTAELAWACIIKPILVSMGSFIKPDYIFLILSLRADPISTSDKGFPRSQFLDLPSLRWRWIYFYIPQCLFINHYAEFYIIWNFSTTYFLPPCFISLIVSYTRIFLLFLLFFSWFLFRRNCKVLQACRTARIGKACFTGEKQAKSRKVPVNWITRLIVEERRGPAFFEG